MKNFRGQKIYPAKQPNPKKNQVWINNDNIELQRVLSVNKDKNKEIISALFESETGEKFELGCAWLNGKEYTYIGDLYY